MRQKHKDIQQIFQVMENARRVPSDVLRLGALLLSRPSAVQEGEEGGGGEGQEGKGVQEQAVCGDRCGCVCGAAGEAARIRPAAGSGIAGSRCIFSCLLRVVSILPFPAELGRAKACGRRMFRPVGHVRRGPRFGSSWCIEAAATAAVHVAHGAEIERGGVHERVAGALRGFGRGDRPVQLALDGARAA